MLSTAKTRLLHALRQRKGRETEGLFLAEGVRVAEELTAAGYDLSFAVCATSLEDTDRGRTLIRGLEGQCAVERVEEHVLRKLAATEQPQGIVIVARIPPLTLRDVRLDTRSTVIIADAVQDPGNFGTLIRIADAFAAAAVLALPGTVDIWNPKSVRSSAGSHFHLPVLATSTDQAGEWLRNTEFQVIGAAAEATPIESLQLQDRVALMVGNEGAGLSEGARSLADALVAVEMQGRAESLNVAVATGILLYVISRR